MTEFRGFSQAARSYTQNLSVVQAMENLLKGELQQFHDALRDAVQALIAPLQVRDEISRESDGDWSCWWVARSEEEGKAPWKERTRPWVVFNGSPQSLVLGREVVCYVPGPGYLMVEEQQMLRIADLADDPELQALGVARSPESWALLIAKVVYGDGSPVEKLSPVIAALLRKLDQVRGPDPATGRTPAPRRP